MSEALMDLSRKHLTQHINKNKSKMPKGPFLLWRYSHLKIMSSRIKRDIINTIAQMNSYTRIKWCLWHLNLIQLSHLQLSIIKIIRKIKNQLVLILTAKLAESRLHHDKISSCQINFKMCKFNNLKKCNWYLTPDLDRNLISFLKLRSKKSQQREIRMVI